jgi:hypothetical protein
MFGWDSLYKLIWKRAKLCKMYIKIINKNNNRWLWYKQDGKDGGLRFHKFEVLAPKGLNLQVSKYELC